jgi:hypothetical protein
VAALRGKDAADAVNAVRQTLPAAAAAGLAAAVGLAFTARTFYLSRRGQVTDRYTKAVALLASDKMAERVGAVYALEHVMVQSPVDHDTVVNVLVTFNPSSASRESRGLAIDVRRRQPRGASGTRRPLGGRAWRGVVRGVKCSRPGPIRTVLTVSLNASPQADGTVHAVAVSRNPLAMSLTSMTRLQTSSRHQEMLSRDPFTRSSP